MKSIRFKVLAMLGIIVAGAVLSAALSLYALSRSNDLNARSDTQGEIALVTERINTQVFAVVMDSRGIYMSKDAKEAEAFAKPKEARFPVMRKLAADLVALVPAAERETRTSSPSVARRSGSAARSRPPLPTSRATTIRTAPIARR